MYDGRTLFWWNLRSLSLCTIARQVVVRGVPVEWVKPEVDVCAIKLTPALLRYDMYYYPTFVRRQSVSVGAGGTMIKDIRPRSRT